MECNHIHGFNPNEEDDDEDDILSVQRAVDAWVEEQRSFAKPAFCNGNNEMVKIFNQKRVICFENPTVYAFRPCDHQCIGEKCYQNKSDIDILICIICRTEWLGKTNAITIVVGIKKNIFRKKLNCSRCESVVSPCAIEKSKTLGMFYSIS